MSKDLGTYYVRVELEDGRGWIERWNTGARFVGGGTDHVSPLTSLRQRPGYESEEQLIDCIVFSFTEGDGSCDCNKALSLARAYNQDVPDDPECGDTMPVKRLTLIRPDGEEKTIYEA